jgi:hypothetical protein
MFDDIRRSVRLAMLKPEEENGYKWFVPVTPVA